MKYFDELDAAQQEQAVTLCQGVMADLPLFDAAGFRDGVRTLLRTSRTYAFEVAPDGRVVRWHALPCVGGGVKHD